MGRGRRWRRRGQRTVGSGFDRVECSCCWRRLSPAGVRIAIWIAHKLRFEPDLAGLEGVCGGIVIESVREIHSTEGLLFAEDGHDILDGHDKQAVITLKINGDRFLRVEEDLVVLLDGIVDV